MTKHYFKAILISLLAVAAWSQTAVADEPATKLPMYYEGDELDPDNPPKYGKCGDGVIEVNPYAGADVGTRTDASWNGRLWNSPWETLTGYSEPGAYFYGGSDPANGFPPQTPWPIAAGEMCDKGPNSPVLCSAACVLINKVDNTSTINAGQFLNKDIVKCYQDRNCSVGIGNGIIQPDAPYFEECDDGNITAGDGCSPLGRIELAEKYVSGVCGNGIVEDPNEECDDGNVRNDDGCNSNCQIEPSPRSCNGTVNHAGQQLCGNGRVDYAFGEQCDDGEKKDRDESNCRLNCVLKSSPQFDTTKYAFWPVPDSPRMYMDFDPRKKSETYGPFTPKDDRMSSKVKVQNRGQKLIIPLDKDTQLSGIYFTGQDISELGNKSIFKDEKIHLSMVVSPSERIHDTDARWDDDAFGIVFGVDGENQDKFAESNPGYKYLMLSWRSYQPNTWTRRYISPGCDDDESSKENYGTPGLRLYQVTGSPTYQQLWTMNSGCKSLTGSIEEIKTDDLTDWTGSNSLNTGNPKGFPWAPSESSWNKVINPFLRLNTFYALDFGLGQGDLNQRLQIDTEFSEEELKVWVNRVLAIHITKANLPPEYTWPTKGQLGFYFLGMDNITVDTSGYYSYVEDTSNIDQASKKESTTCSNYCGNGIIENDDDPKVYSEQCDDGNTVDGDGCSSTCTLENNSDLCRDYNGEVLCFGGAITGPKDGQSVKTKNPTISGTYVGDPADIKVTITNGTASCEGSVKGGEVKKNADGTWAFNKDCNLADGEHEVTVDFVPTQSTQGTNFPIIKETSTFTVDSENGQAISLQVDQPAGDKVFIPNGTNLPVSGTSDNANTIHVEICEKGTSTCPISKDFTPDKTTGHGSWADTIDTSSLTEGKNYTIKFTAKNGSKESQTVTKNLEVTNGTLGDPVITNIKKDETPKIIPNADGTITVEGIEPIPDKCKVNSQGTTPEDSYFDPERCPQIYVTIQTAACDAATGDDKKVVVKINKDGSFRGDVPLCTTATTTTGVDVTINAKASDSAGNVSGDTQRTVKIVEKSEPKILITCPKSTSTAGDCLLLDGKSGGMGLVVNGESNIKSERPVTVTAYPKNGEKCDFAPAALGEPVGTITTTTTPEGKWAVDFKHVKSGDYCIVAKLTTKDGKNPVNTTTANGYQRGQLDEPEFVDSAKEITEDIYNATSGTVSIRVAVDLNSNIAVGDKCEVSVERRPDWKGTGVYRLDGDQYVCDAPVPVTDPSDAKNKLVGETLVAKSVPFDDSHAVASGDSSDMPLPTAKIVKVTGKEKVDVEIGEDFPGAAEGVPVTFDVGGGTSVSGNSCKLGALDPITKVYTCSAPPVLKNKENNNITEIDANTSVTASLGGKELEGTVTIEGKPTIDIECPSTSGGSACQVGGANAKGIGVTGTTNAKAGRNVTVKVFEKGTLDCNEVVKQPTPIVQKTSEVLSDGAPWAFDFKNMPPGNYCIVAEVTDESTVLSEDGPVEYDYIRTKLSTPTILETPTKLAEEAIKAKADGHDTIPVTVQAPDDSNIAVGDKCVVTVDSNSAWKAEDTFSKNSATGKLECTVNVPVTDPGNAGESIFGKELTAVAKSQSENSAVNVEDTSPVSDGRTVPGLPTLVPDGDGKVTFTIQDKYPGVGCGDTVEFKSEDGNTSYGSCNMPQCNPTQTEYKCVSNEPLKDGNKKLINLDRTTTVVPYVANTKVPEVTANIVGTPTNNIICPDGDTLCATPDDREMPVRGTSTANENTEVTVTLYEKGSGTCETGHGDQIAAQTVQVQNGEWNATFSDLPSGEYCIISTIKGSTDDKATSTKQVNYPGLTLGQPAIDESPTDIAKKVIEAGDSKVSITVTKASGSNIKEGDKCIVKVKDESGWESDEGTFSPSGDCMVKLDAKKDGKSLLGKTLIAEAIQKDNPGNTSTAEGPTLPGKPVLSVNPDTGVATVTVDKTYPGVEVDKVMTFKVGTETVGTCKLAKTVPDSDQLVCVSTEPLKEESVKLIDKKESSTVTVELDNKMVPEVDDTVNGVGQIGQPAIKENATQIAEGVLNPTDGKVSITVTPAPGSNIKTGDKCVVKVKDEAGWESEEGEFNDSRACMVKLDAKKDGKTLLGKTLVAEAIQNGNPGNTSTAEGPTLPGKPTMNIGTDGTVTVNIDKGYPVTPDQKITFKQGDKEVGSCEVKRDGENWICTSKLNDNATKGEVTAVLGGKDVAKANYTPADSGQGGDNNPGGTYTEKDNEVIVKLPPEVVRENDLEVGQKLTILGPDKKQIGDPCTIRNGENGNLICIVSNTKSPVPAKADLSGFVTDRQGMQPFRITPGDEEPTYGFVAGGCSTTDSPESGLLALLFAALGFFGIRRRRD